MGPELSGRVLVAREPEGCEGAVKFLFPLGPVGGLNPAGPLGGERGAAGRTGERSLGVDFAESLSRTGIWLGGDLARGGERALEEGSETRRIRSG